MSSRKRQFKDQDVIYREGDRATRAFQVISGKVEMTRDVDGKTKRLDVIGAGKTIGLDDLAERKHKATAIAVGAVVLRPLDRQEAKQQAETAQASPTASGGLFGWLKALLIPPSTPSPPGDQPPRRRFSLLGMFRQLKEASNPDPAKLDIRLTPLDQDPDGIVDLLRGYLEARDGIRVRLLKKPVEVPEDTPPDQRLSRLHWSARQALAMVEGDLCVHVETARGERTVKLKLFPLGIQEEDAPGSFLPAMTITLPTAVNPVFGDFLYLCCVAATVPMSDPKRATRTELLTPALEAAMPVLEVKATDLLTHDQAVLMIAMADAIHQVGHLKGKTDLQKSALELYQRALEIIGDQDTSLEKAQALRQTAILYQQFAPELEDIETQEQQEASQGPLHKALDHLKACEEVFVKDQFPKEWAALQHRLGQVYYRVDAHEGNADLLRNAINAYQAALQVYTRADHPLKWAEVMNNFGLAAAVLGEQLHSTELLEKAVEASQNALQVRRKMEFPMLWAASQNNLGSALFMLAKQTNNDDQYDAALEAFTLARGVYMDRDAHRMIAIAEKNMTRVVRAIELKRPKNPPPLPWEQSDDGRDEDPFYLDDDDDDDDDPAYDAPNSGKDNKQSR